MGNEEFIQPHRESDVDEKAENSFSGVVVIVRKVVGSVVSSSRCFFFLSNNPMLSTYREGSHDEVTTLTGASHE
jgi:hypothetical protein